MRRLIIFLISCCFVYQAQAQSTSDPAVGWGVEYELKLHEVSLSHTAINLYMGDKDFSALTNAEKVEMLDKIFTEENCLSLLQKNNEIQATSKVLISEVNYYIDLKKPDEVQIHIIFYLVQGGKKQSNL